MVPGGQGGHEPWPAVAHHSELQPLKHLPLTQTQDRESIQHSALLLLPLIIVLPPLA